MPVKTITFTLDSSSINSAIEQLRAYANGIEDKTKRLRQLVGERIQWTAQAGFSSAIVSDVVEGTPPVSDVQVFVEDDGDVTVVFATGEQAVFIEYGAGVYHNGAEGTSPHPWGAAFGYLIGQYGKGKGKYDVWSYYDNGEKVYTMGTPAAMPMYRGYQEAISTFGSLVQEVFG